MSKKSVVFRSVRKSAHLTRKVATKAANFSGRVEKKADRIIHGTDPTVQIHDKVLQEKIFDDALHEITPIHPCLPSPGRKGEIVLLLPSLQKSSFFGGTATALLFAAELAKKKGSRLRVLETLKAADIKNEEKVKQLIDFFGKNSYEFNGRDIKIIDLASRRYDHYGYIEIHPDDIFVASAWWDAYLLDKLPLTKKYVYLIQDYEPIFYNNSDQFALAESTYRNESFIPVCNTKLMYDFMGSKGYEYIKENGLFFEPAVNIGKSIGYNEGKKPAQKKILFIYGRPSVHRNLFYLALETVNQAFAQGDLQPGEWEVFMGGQDKLPNILLDCGVTVNNLGKMTIEEYYDFAKTVDLALSLMMAPHPSYPPLELASLGATVVTTGYETKKDLSIYSKNIIVKEAHADSLVQGIKEALRIPSKTRLENAKSINLPANWHESMKDTIQKTDSLL